MGQVNYIRFTTKQKYEESKSSITSDDIVFIQESRQIINNNINYSNGFDIVTDWSTPIVSNQQVHSAELTKELYEKVNSQKSNNIVWAARISEAGAILDEYKSDDKYSFSTTRERTGFYKVNHNLNTYDYIVQLTPYSAEKATFALLEGDPLFSFFRYATKGYTTGLIEADAAVNILIYKLPT